MPRLQRVHILVLVFAAVLLTSPLVTAQPAKDTPVAAPIPVQIATSKRVFISNCGLDDVSHAMFERAGDPQQPYNRFYAAMKDWGRYELVAVPADADLVFEIRFGAPITDSKESWRGPQFGLTILDAGTHFTLWSLFAPVEGAMRKATWDKNFDQGIDRLMNDLKMLAAQAAPTASAQKQ